jgi:hypothetical protein
MSNFKQANSPPVEKSDQEMESSQDEHSISNQDLQEQVA